MALRVLTFPPSRRDLLIVCSAPAKRVVESPDSMAENKGDSHVVMQDAYAMRIFRSRAAKWVAVFHILNAYSKRMHIGISEYSTTKKRSISLRI